MNQVLEKNMNNVTTNRIFTVPNIISFFRILLVIPIAYNLWHENLILVGVLVWIGFLSDYADGILARRLNQITKLGKMLDPFADKLNIGVCVIILYLKGMLPIWLMIIIVGRDIMLSIGGLFMAGKYNKVVSSNFLGKVTVNILAITIFWYIVGVEVLAKIFMVFSVIFVVWSGVCYFIRFLNDLKTQKEKLMDAQD